MRLDGRTQLRHVVDLDLVHDVTEQVPHAQPFLLADAGVLFRCQLIILDLVLCVCLGLETSPSVEPRSARLPIAARLRGRLSAHMNLRLQRSLRSR